MKTNLNTHISIAEQIIDGSITIKSIEEFKSILKIFPNDAALQKAYSNLLQQKNQPDAAVKSYDRAAQLFIEAGKILQAIDSKMLQWKIKPPAPQEAQLFYSALRKGSYYESSLKTFFNRLTYPEMVSFVSKLIRTELSPGKMIKKAGEEEKDLYFVVSGNLKETIFVPLRKKERILFIAKEHLFYPKISSSAMFTPLRKKTDQNPTLKPPPGSNWSELRNPI